MEAPELSLGGWRGSQLSAGGWREALVVVCRKSVGLAAVFRRMGDQDLVSHSLNISISLHAAGRGHINKLETIFSLFE